MAKRCSSNSKLDLGENLIDQVPPVRVSSGEYRLVWRITDPVGGVTRHTTLGQNAGDVRLRLHQAADALTAVVGPAGWRLASTFEDYVRKESADLS